jgi:hypothetical protein
VVAVANSIYFNKNWKTFPDFLTDFVRRVLGPDWGNEELRKSEAEMHPVALWYRKNSLLQAAHAGKPGEVFTTPETGAARAYLELAYNLYLLEHNVELRARLINRLKHPDQFLGALSEIRVAGMFVRAGFAIDFADEDNNENTHCEYDVTRAATGKKFSVEVKTRHWDKNFPSDSSEGRRQVCMRVSRLLRAALGKKAEHDRIAFIELAMSDQSQAGQQTQEPWWMQAAVDGIRDAERVLREQDLVPPSAIVIIGNHPHHLHLDTTSSIVGYAVDGIGPTDFRSGLSGSLRDALRFREAHGDFLALWRSIEKHRNIPTTFDGTNRYLAFGDHPHRLQIGA